MARREIIKEALERKMETYKKYQQFRDKEELDRVTEQLISQIKMAEQINIINTIRANEYLSELERNYISILHSEQFKEWREQVINFSDDFVTSRERLFSMRKAEKVASKHADSGYGMFAWKKEVNRSGTLPNAGGNNERDEIEHDKQEERDEMKEENWK